VRAARRNLNRSKGLTPDTSETCPEGDAEHPCRARPDRSVHTDVCGTFQTRPGALWTCCRRVVGRPVGAGTSGRGTRFRGAGELEGAQSESEEIVPRTSRCQPGRSQMPLTRKGGPLPPPSLQPMQRRRPAACGLASAPSTSLNWSSGMNCGLARIPRVPARDPTRTGHSGAARDRLRRKLTASRGSREDLRERQCGMTAAGAPARGWRGS
jgi:hypothetical protein